MRLVIASDTHEQHEGLTVPDGDVFIHCGDLTYRGDLHAIAQAGNWIRSLPHRTKIVIAGNHDWGFERVPVQARKALGAGTWVLIVSPREWLWQEYCHGDKSTSPHLGK